MTRKMKCNSKSNNAHVTQPNTECDNLLPSKYATEKCLLLKRFIISVETNQTVIQLQMVEKLSQ